MMTAPFLTQDDRELLHESCQEVWDEVNSLLDVHGRDPNVVQVVEFGGPSDSPPFSLLQQQGGSSFVANLTEGYDLGTRGGCHRSRQQTENLQPNFAWFQLPEGPPRRDSCPEDSKHRALVQKSRKVIRHVIALSQLQLQHGECVWISDKHSSPWRDPEACQFWQYLAEAGRAFEWHCGDLQVRTSSRSMYLDCSRVSASQSTPEEHLSQLHTAILGSVQWRVYQTAPQHAAKLNYLQLLVASEGSSIVEQVDKLVREVYASRSLSVQIQALGADDPEQWCMVGRSDASLANRPDFSFTLL